MQSGKGSLGFLRAVVLTASHKDVDWALGQAANAVDGTTLTCIGHRVSPGKDKQLC